MAKPTTEDRKRRAKYRRARIRNIVFTVGPNRLTGGRAGKRHLSSKLHLHEIELRPMGWPKEFDGVRIGHLSDFHLGELITLDRALEAVALLEEQEPDLVVCTGDVVDLHHTEAAPLLEALATIDAPMGSALVLGNHDELHCPHTLRRMATEAGLQVLDDAVLVLRKGGDELRVAGISWAKEPQACAERVRTVAEPTPHVLLSHNPRSFVEASSRGVPLTLSGHTHGGQIALRDNPAANLAFAHKHSAGLYERNGSWLFVTRGVGSWFPLRVNCPPEVAIVTVRCRDDESD
jgi:predicted MPP superfamily phosphohydrolase